MNRLAICVLLLGASTPIRLVAQQRSALNLVTHSRIDIGKPAATIWPYILDPSQWKQGLGIRHRSGPPGAVGEILAAVDPATPNQAAFLVETVELEPNHRRTIKLYEPGGTLLGYATWTLVETAGRTVVGYDVYSETLLSPSQAAGMTDSARGKLEREGFEANQKRFDAELVALKRLVEGRR